MAFRSESRWWIVTLVIIGVLMGISALALDRPNVVWHADKPHCPACRGEVAFYSSKCSGCSAQFDWVVAPDEASPLSQFSLSAIESEELLRTVKELGEDEAVSRVARAAGFSEESARAYLDRIGRGRCGWCGGTGKDLDAEAGVDQPCVLCLGDGGCVACGGDHRQRLGVWAAEQALAVYQREAIPLRTAGLPPEVEMKESWRLAHDFLRRHAGTVQAEKIEVPRRAGGDHGPIRYVAAPELARRRLRKIVQALKTGP